MDALSAFRRGFAVGQSDIRGDCLHFRFYSEFFIVKERAFATEAEGGFLLAPIAKVRAAADG